MLLKKCFGEINEPLKHLFNLSLEKETFPEKMDSTFQKNFLVFLMCLSVSCITGYTNI